MLTWMLEVHDMFVGPHPPFVLLRKQTVEHIGHKLAYLRPRNARFGLTIILYCRLPRLHAALLSAVADTRWIENFDKSSANHPVKILILDDARWDCIVLLEMVSPVAFIVKLGDSHKPALPRLCPEMIMCRYSSGAISRTSAATTTRDTLTRPQRATLRPKC